MKKLVDVIEPTPSFCPTNAVGCPVWAALQLNQQSKVKSWLPRVKSAESSAVTASPDTPSNSAEAPPNLLCTVSIRAPIACDHACADPPAFASANVVDASAPSKCSRILVKLSLPDGGVSVAVLSCWRT